MSVHVFIIIIFLNRGGGLPREITLRSVLFLPSILGLTASSIRLASCDTLGILLLTPVS